MRFKINKPISNQAKDRDKQKWHRWFAWHPVWVSENDLRWLEPVYRHGKKTQVAVHDGIAIHAKDHWDYSYSANPNVIKTAK